MMELNGVIGDDFKIVRDDGGSVSSVTGTVTFNVPNGTGAFISTRDEYCIFKVVRITASS